MLSKRFSVYSQQICNICYMQRTSTHSLQNTLLPDMLFWSCCCLRNAEMTLLNSFAVYGWVRVAPTRSVTTRLAKTAWKRVWAWIATKVWWNAVEKAVLQGRQRWAAGTALGLQRGQVQPAGNSIRTCKGQKVCLKCGKLCCAPLAGDPEKGAQLSLAVQI